MTLDGHLLLELVAAALLLAGSAFMLLAAVGVLRLPDLYLRLSATTKSATLGVSCLLGGVAAGFADGEAAFTALLVVAFFLLTAPVAGHMIGRAAYFAGVPLWEGTRHDELRSNGVGLVDGAPEEGAEAADADPTTVPVEGRWPDAEPPAGDRDPEPAGAAVASAGASKGDLP